MEEFWFKVKFYLMKLAYYHQRSRARRYTLPIILVLLVFPLTALIPKPFFQLVHSQTISFLVLILVVTVASWYGGLGPGLMATALTMLVNYFTLGREDLPIHPPPGELIVGGVYILVGFIISILSETRREVEMQKDEFIGLLSHELKNPLSSIIGFSGLLKLDKKISQHQIFKYAEYIHSQSNKMLELINDLLDVTKIGVGKFSYKDEIIDFGDLVQEIIVNQQIINPKREIRCKGKCNQIIKGDRYRIGQVITNLLTNALKYSPEKSPVEIRVKGGKKGISVAVKDQGIGIPKEEQKTIFTRYYRTRSARKGKTEGVGLGLFIANQIVEAHRGRLWVKSNESKGSTFYFSLPKKY